jgi:pyruvate,orthophosphate dikinase
VAGIRITEPLNEMGTHFPECHQQLIDVMHTLENHYRDMCDIEFTIEQGRLFILQTRVGKRTAAAALRMAVEMEQEGMIDKREAVLRVQPAQLDQLLHPQFDPAAKYSVLATGLNASPGAAVGQVYFTADEAEAKREAGERVILVRPETSPDDLHGMIAAEGILTSRGGLVSHAAVVARGMGKPAICGAESV